MGQFKFQVNFQLNEIALLAQYYSWGNSKESMSSQPPLRGFTTEATRVTSKHFIESIYLLSSYPVI